MSQEPFNPPVSPEGLPALEDVPLTPVSPRFAPYRVLGTMLFWMPLAVAVVLLPVGPELPWPVRAALGGAVLLVGVGVAVLAAIEARRRAFGLRREDVIYSSGLLVRRTTILPVCRIQHVETVSGPLERLFGLVRLTCFTAGGSSADLVMAGLRSETADRLRQHLLHRIREGSTADGPPTDDNP